MAATLSPPQPEAPGCAAAAGAASGLDAGNGAPTVHAHVALATAGRDDISCESLWLA